MKERNHPLQSEYGAGRHSIIRESSLERVPNRGYRVCDACGYNASQQRGHSFHLKRCPQCDAEMSSR